MKLLLTLLMLLQLAVPAGMVAQVVAGPTSAICAVVDEDGGSCCEAAAIRCCCDATPEKDPPTRPAPAPLPSAPFSPHDAAAALPFLIVITELPRIGENPAHEPAPAMDAPPAVASRVSPCALRCSFLI